MGGSPSSVSSTLDYLFARLWPYRAPLVDWQAITFGVHLPLIICSGEYSANTDARGATSLTFEDQEMPQVIFHGR